ncbi:phosphotransferase [Agarivorans sp. DSG3-1]|uniref:phosphotransferase n=1 Tax=Agarivorans sp. DSG3-1 TaxID=3342249 RepID=UPI00398EF89D
MESLALPTSALEKNLLSYLERHLGCILKVDRLAGGHQHSWLLETNTERLVLRLNQQQPCYGLDYQREREVLQQLNHLPWVINMHPLSLNGEFLLYQFQEGEVVSLTQWQQPTLWPQLLKVLHQLPSAGKGLPHFDMLKYLQRYVNDISASEAASFRRQALQWIKQQNWPQQQAFNHHDLHLDNLLLSSEQKLLVLDWEYAATSMQGWDAASVAQRCPVTAEQRADLIAISDLNSGQFELLVVAVALLDLAWYWQYQPQWQGLLLRTQQWLNAQGLANSI